MSLSTENHGGVCSLKINRQSLEKVVDGQGFLSVCLTSKGTTNSRQLVDGLRMPRESRVETCIWPVVMNSPGALVMS